MQQQIPKGHGTDSTNRRFKKTWCKRSFLRTFANSMAQRIGRRSCQALLGRTQPRSSPTSPPRFHLMCSGGCLPRAPSPFFSLADESTASRVSLTCLPDIIGMDAAMHVAGARPPTTIPQIPDFLDLMVKTVLTRTHAQRQCHKQERKQVARASCRGNADWTIRRCIRAR